jgi:DNA mismatch endonuclease (patch repair protein)
MRSYVRDARSPKPLNERVSRTMSAIRAKHTGPEKKMRALLRESDLGKYNLHLRSIPGRPDIVYPKQKVAIFVHGCYWHGCRYCRLSLPKTNRAFWKNKIETNRARDFRKNRQLRTMGWRVVTIRECQLKTTRGKERSFQRVRAALRRSQ